MKKRKDILEQKFSEYTGKFAYTSKEELEAKVENISEQIEEKKEQLRKTKNEEEMDNLEKVIAKMEKEKDTMSGYNKNKTKIEKIREYKERLNNKINPLKVEKAKLENDLKTYIEANKGVLEFINKTLNNPKMTENMNNKEYNELLVKKEQVENGKKEIEDKIEKIDKKIEVLVSSVSKCDLAWKSLFTDRSWDEIQVRAVQRNYTRKLNNKAKTAESKKINNETERETEQEDEEIALTDPESFKERHPNISKVFDWFKNVGNKVYSFISGDEKTFEEEDQENKQAPKKVKTTRKSKAEANKENNVERDAFIEELRRYVENDKADKEQEYIEKHKVKNVNKEEKER